jgi:opacity protein-like surface antigen
VKNKFAAVLLGLAVVTGAHAQESFYAGGLLTRIDYSEDGLDAKPTAIGFNVGAKINQNFAVEGRVSTGLSDDSVQVLGVIPADVKVKSLFGIYGKGILPLSDTASIYGLLGYSRVKLGIEGNGFDDSASDSDVSYGVGAEFALTNTTSLAIEWAQLLKVDDAKVSGLTLGVSFKF